jgi:hypothetical protein
MTEIEVAEDDNWTIKGVGGITAPVEGSRYYSCSSTQWHATGTERFWIKPLYEDLERGKKTTLPHLRTTRGAIVNIGSIEGFGANCPFRTWRTSKASGTATLRRIRRKRLGDRWDNRAAGQGNLRRSGGGNMTDDKIFTAAPGQGLVVSTGILGDLVLPEGTFHPECADEIRDLAAQAAVYATQARGLGTLRAYRSVWRQYDAARTNETRGFDT